MKKITDERLILRNLYNVRIVYIVQTIGILFILGYELFQGGMERVTNNPLWLVFLLSSIVYGYLSMSVSVAHEKEINNPQKSFVISLIVLLMIVAVVTSLVSITPDYHIGHGLLFGAILFICGIIPIYYVFRLRVKQAENFEED